MVSSRSTSNKTGVSNCWTRQGLAEQLSKSTEKFSQPRTNLICHLFFDGVFSLRLVLPIPRCIHVPAQLARQAGRLTLLPHSSSPLPRVNLVPQASRSYDIRVRAPLSSTRGVIRAFLRPHSRLQGAFLSEPPSLIHYKYVHGSAKKNWQSVRKVDGNSLIIVMDLATLNIASVSEVQSGRGKRF